MTLVNFQRCAQWHLSVLYLHETTTRQLKRGATGPSGGGAVPGTQQGGIFHEVNTWFQGLLESNPPKLQQLKREAGQLAFHLIQHKTGVFKPIAGEEAVVLLSRLKASRGPAATASSEAHTGLQVELQARNILHALVLAMADLCYEASLFAPAGFFEHLDQGSTTMVPPLRATRVFLRALSEQGHGCSVVDGLPPETVSSLGTVRASLASFVLLCSPWPCVSHPSSCFPRFLRTAVLSVALRFSSILPCPPSTRSSSVY